MVMMFLLLGLVVHAEDWTVNGKTYPNVKVLKVELAQVSIMYDGGITHLTWTDLTPEIQKELGAQHDPLAAEVKAQKDALAVADAAKVKAAADLQAQQEAIAKNFATLDKASVSGQVFIVTKGGENIKLGSIHVYLYSEEGTEAIVGPLVDQALAGIKRIKPTMDAQYATCKQLKATLDDYKANGVPNGTDLDAFGSKAENAFTQYRNTLSSYYFYFSQTYYTKALPTPLADAQTDADGKFIIQIPKTGSWVLEAEGERKVVKDTEAYLWITKVTRDMIDKGQVFLNNENLSTSDSSNSLVKTMDYTERSEIIDTANYLVPKPDDTSSN